MIYTIVRKDENDKIDAVISFDSVSGVDESWSATVTSQTVESGFNISDNINIEAPTYSITAILSSYSLFNQDKEIVWDGQDFTTPTETDRESHIAARDEIIDIFKDRSIVSLIESTANSNNSNLDEKYQEITSSYNREIDTCVITSLSIEHPDQGTGAFIVSMTIQKVNLARIEISELGEGEKRALLRPLMKTREEVKTKSEKSEGTIDPETGLPSEESIPESAKGNREEMAKYYEELYGIKASEEYLDAVERATYLMKTTGKAHSVVKTGTSYTVIKGLNASALLTVGGRADDNR